MSSIYAVLVVAMSVLVVIIDLFIYLSIVITLFFLLLTSFILGSIASFYALQLLPMM